MNRAILAMIFAVLPLAAAAQETQQGASDTDAAG